MQYTPAMQQYIDIKKQNPDCILFFRIWDFYETFWEDAKICSKVLDILLTSKNKDSESPIPLAGIPYHSIDKYIPKLIHHGYKIAIAEQMTDPVPGKIVERQITKIITPGTFIQESKKNSTYTLALCFSPQKDNHNYHIARGDFSLGEYWTKSFYDIQDVQKFAWIINPVELILDIDLPDQNDIANLMKQYLNCLISVSDKPYNEDEYLINQCKIQTLASYGKAIESGRKSALALLFNYLETTQKTNLTNISRIALHSNNSLVLLDEVTIKNLEIFSSSYEWSEKYSLIGTLDNTKTAGWSRLLRHILANPVNNFDEINRRLSHIDYYLSNDHEAKTIHYIFSHIADIQKIISNLLYKKLLPSGFMKLRAILRTLFYKDWEEIDIIKNELIRIWLSNQTLESVSDFYNTLQDILKDDDDFSDDVNFVRDGVDNDIDELRKIAFHSDSLLINYQQILSEITGTNNVKVKFIINQWYFIEITNKDIEWFEAKLKEYLDSKNIDNNLDQEENEEAKKYQLYRRNTLKWWQRYSSRYLDNLQEDILEARQKLVKQEFITLNQLKNKLESIIGIIAEFSEHLAWLDVFVSHSILSKENQYIKPSIILDNQLNIVGARHPVIEKFLPIDQQFIENDLIQNSSNIHIITWPNMWGKSTYLRQNALIVLMAHCGLFVPAQKAEIWLVDAIFARVWSGDVIAKNQSTFMTEMIEVSNILNNATEKSFIIFDELGRWTSTYDWLALTKAILEYITTDVKAKTLIATHYHELIALEWQLPWVKNYSVTVYETDREVVFMKKISPGWASKSYGLDVAKLAGISQKIIEKAKYNLEHLESNGFPPQLTKREWQNEALFAPTPIPNDPKFEKIKALLWSFDINNMTPLQALQLLSKVKEEI